MSIIIISSTTILLQYYNYTIILKQTLSTSRGSSEQGQNNFQFNGLEQFLSRSIARVDDDNLKNIILGVNYLKISYIPIVGVTSF